MDHLINELVLTAGGILSGILAGLLGAGGGVLCIPLLIALNYSPIQALGTSCLAVSIISISGSIQNFRMGCFSPERVIFIGIPALVTAQISAYAVSQVSPQLLLIAFGTVMLFLIYLVRLRKKLNTEAKMTAVSKKAVAEVDSRLADEETITYFWERSSIVNSGLAICAIEKSATFTNTTIEKPFQRWLKSIMARRLTTGSLAGLFAGMAGGGSGTLLVPLQMLFLGESIKLAIQTSVGVNVITSISAWIGHATRGNVLFLDGFLLGVGGFVGAQIGTRFLPKLPDKVVSFAFNTMVVCLAFYVYWKAWNI